MAHFARLGAVALTLLLPLGLGTTVVSSPSAAAGEFPGLRVTPIVTDLTIPWDVLELPDGHLLIDERTSGRILVWDGAVREVASAQPNHWAMGESGLLGMALDPGFVATGRFYIMRTVTSGTRQQVRVEAWRLNQQQTAATPVKVLLGGIQITTGNHAGGRLLMGSDGFLYVGTGDSLVGTNPQDLRSLNGKVLRLDPATGAPAPGNPFATAANTKQRYVYNYGHRNVQGLAERSDGTIFEVEHGPDRDDEVNLMVSGGNYGWNPVPGYTSRTPMTDHSLPGVQLNAKWRSGFPTDAPSGAAWVRGEHWGGYDGMLAVGVLKAERLMFLRFDAAGTFVVSRIPAATQAFGRLRSVTRTTSGALLVTTSNGNGTDIVLKVEPR